MTCPSMLRRPHAVDVLRHGIGSGHGHRVVRAVLDRETGRAQLARYAMVGAVSSALYAVLFVAVEGAGEQPANLVGAIASTLLANELHRRLTFHAGGRVGWFTAQWEGGGLAALGLVATSLALAALDHLADDPGWAVQVLLIGAVTGAVGLARFMALRAWVFHRSPARGE
ncbi:GtrA family protein [Klenkia sp. LSe6-5]|uniref:GtrA family protein n=1 Tax=Klenkia sesuvii TaxID=3103137 RepID=A0ABU8DQD4_9ACTN